MKEFIINEIHLIITLVTLLIYVILCGLTNYTDPAKLNQTQKNVSFARIVFGFLTALCLLSLEFRYVTIVFKDNVLLRSLELISCIALIILFLYATENKVIQGDTYDKIFKILNPLIIAVSIMASGSLNNLLNHYKDAVIASK
jgi:hypothetical protein